MISLLSHSAPNQGTYHEKGYIEKIEPIDRLSLCGSAIIYIKDFNGISKKMYINLSEKKFNELNNYEEFTFEITYSKANRVLTILDFFCLLMFQNHIFLTFLDLS